MKTFILQKGKKFCTNYFCILFLLNFITFNSFSNNINDNKANVPVKILNDTREEVLGHIKTNYNLEANNVIKATIGISIINETVWILNLIKEKKITNTKEIKYLLNQIENILTNLKIVKESYKEHTKWQVTLKDIDLTLLPKLPTKKRNRTYFSKNHIKVEKLEYLLKNIKQIIPQKSSYIIDNIYINYLDLNEGIGINKKAPNKLKKILYDLNINFLVMMILNRGILAPDCKWFAINDKLIKDKSGINIYEDIKKGYGKPIVSINVLGKPINLIYDNSFIKQMLDQSPYIFGVGRLKKYIFRSFMKKNVGISEGKPWYNRRRLNDAVLCFNKLHRYAPLYNNAIKQTLNKYGLPKNFDEFIKIGRKITSKIVFNVDLAPDYIFEIFSKANSLKSLTDEDFHIDEKTMSAYLNYLNKHIDNPNPNSLIESAVKYIDYCPSSNACKSEIIYQIPHWIFPNMGVFISVIPRLLLFLANHPEELNKVIEEIKNIDINNSQEIYNLKYLRKCILESVRLNNIVVTLFRTLLKDYSFGKDSLGNEYKFDKGTQFLILTNPILREPEKFKNPNKFIPSRWSSDLENSYYAIMFGQGPQRCPGKEVAIFLMQSFVANYLKNLNFKLKSSKININYIEQMINPCKIKFK
ncbi:MAG: cytochrome P450 [Bacteroidetes bacterium]|nr:cytochrome P450 [Bacteroidota bacterium]